tara:strand:+ start:101 stop:898 length:798 start_codon:yes stop_codon:yes gene_type:complete
MSQIPASNVTKDDFGWEIPVEVVPLPSNGTIYSPDTTLYNKETLQIKAMTAKEEDILSSQAYIKEGVVIKKLIESCITDKSFDVDDLITGDRNALMVSIRITGYGSDYNITHTCKKCSHNQPVTVNLTELPIKRLQHEPVVAGRNIFSFELPVTKKIVHFKYLSGHDDKEEEVKQKRLTKLNMNSENSITNFLERIIVSIDGIEDKNKISHFVKNMPALDSRKLRLFISESEPGIDMSWQYECKKCMHQNGFSIPITTEFFWPNT